MKRRPSMRAGEDGDGRGRHPVPRSGRHLGLAVAAACGALLSTLMTPGAAAHEIRPAYLELTERGPGEFDVLWKAPALGAPPDGTQVPVEPWAGEADVSAPRHTLSCGCPVTVAGAFSSGVLPIHPVLPGDARILAPPRIERLPGAEVRRWTIRTGARGLEGWEAGVHGLQATMVDALVRVTFADGRVVSRLLRPDAPSFTFSTSEAGAAASGYFVLGVEHILFGIDHLLFVLCLLLLVRGVGRIVKTVTAFTVAHSITLGLASLGHVRMPSAPVESAIALSIVFLAVEILKRRPGAPRFTERRPWLVAFAFGLLHGFGFAGALSEVGLPAEGIPLALLGFNLGVEAGQLLFVAAVLLIVVGTRRLIHACPAWVRPLPAYGIGAMASFWLLARVAAIW